MVLMAKRKKVSKKKPSTKGVLTERKKRFAEEYIIDLNATAAMARVVPKLTHGSAAVEGHKALKDPVITEYIIKLRAEQAKRTGITADRVLEELGKVAFFDLGAAYDEEGNLLNIAAMPEEVRRALSGIKVFEEFAGNGNERMKIGETREVKPADKLRALEMIGRHLKMFTDKLDVDGKITLEDLVAGANKEAE